MSAAPHRRGLLALLGTAPLAAAFGPSDARARASDGLRTGIAGGRFAGAAGRIGPAVERALPPDREIPGGLAQLAAGLDESSRAILARAEARATAAMTTVFPPEIAAYRSFAPHLRRRLYAELLAREAERLARIGVPPPTPQASPGPGA